MKLVLCSIVVFDFQTFDYVRLFKCSISERSIVFDWQNLGVSSVKFDYRTQSTSIERLEFDWVRLTTPGIFFLKMQERPVFFTFT